MQIFKSEQTSAEKTASLLILLMVLLQAFYALYAYISPQAFSEQILLLSMASIRYFHSLSLVFREVCSSIYQFEKPNSRIRQTVRFV